MHSHRQEHPPWHSLFSSQHMMTSHPVVVAMAIPTERRLVNVSQTSPCRLPLPANTDIATSSLPLPIDAKMALERILPLFHHSNWENPSDSIGDRIGRMRNGRYQCWRVKGPALKIYLEIRAQLRECIDVAPKSETVTWGMYMVGHREDNAAPKILICSAEERIRRDIRRRVRDSQLLNRYPGVGLGDTSILPDRFEPTETAKEEIDKILPPDCDIKRDKVVLIKGMEASPGKWIYTVNSDGGSLRAAATSGPFVFINDTWCQLTVSHPFFPSEPWTADSSGAKATIEDDCDFEGMSDVDEEVELEATACASVSSFSVNEESLVDMRSPTETDTQDSCIECDETSDAETSNTISNSRPYTPTRSDSRPTTMSESFGGAEENRPQSFPVHAQNEDLNMSRLQYLGKLGLASDEFKESSQIDYALIVINNGQIPHLTTPQFINLQLVIAKSLSVVDLDEETCAWKQSVRTICPETIDENLDKNFDKNVEVVTLMPRAGPVPATLTPNPTFLRIAGKPKFQEVYPLTLKDATVSKGDSGSPVFDSTGKFCGHIVAGGEGTPHAYIIPAVDIMRDIETHVWGKTNLPTQASMRVAKPIGTLDYASTHARSTTPSQETVRLGADQRPDVKYKDEGTNPEVAESHRESPDHNIAASRSSEEVERELRRVWEDKAKPIVPVDPALIRWDWSNNNMSPRLEAETSSNSTASDSPATMAPARPDKEGGNGRLAYAPAGSKLDTSAPRQAMASKPHILPPPHLRPKASPTPDPIHPGALTAGLSEATLRLMKSWSPSMPGESLFPTGLTVVSAEEELCDSLVESRTDGDTIRTTHMPPSKVDDNFKTSQRTGHLAKEWRSLVIRLSLRLDALEKEQHGKQASQDAESGRESQNHHHHLTGGVRDKFRSITTRIGGSHGGAAKNRKAKAIRHVGHSSKTDLRRYGSWGSSHSVDRYLNTDLGLVG